MPGKTITYRYEMSLTTRPRKPAAALLADIWLSLNGAAYGPLENFVTLASVWPRGRLVRKRRIK